MEQPEAEPTEGEVTETFWSELSAAVPQSQQPKAQALRDALKGLELDNPANLVVYATDEDLAEVVTTRFDSSNPIERLAAKSLLATVRAKLVGFGGPAPAYATPKAPASGKQNAAPAASARSLYFKAKPKWSRATDVVMPAHLKEEATALINSAAPPLCKLSSADLQMWVHSAKTYMCLQGILNGTDYKGVLNRVRLAVAARPVPICPPSLPIGARGAVARALRCFVPDGGHQRRGESGCAASADKHASQELHRRLSAAGVRWRHLWHGPAQPRHQGLK